MTENLKTLTRKRGSQKTRLTLFVKYLEALKDSIADLDVDAISGSVDLKELECRVERQEALLEEFQECQAAIEIACDDFEAQVTERENFENSYFRSLSESKQILEKYTQSKAEQCKVSSSSSDRSVNSFRLHSDKCSHVKLPEIELPKFRGNYENWLEFRDTFASLIHENTDIPDISKFHYLRAQLEGNARQVIHSLEVSKENYSIAWQLVCDRYNNTKLLVYNHIRAVIDMPNISSESSLEYRKLSDNISKHLRALVSLKQPVEHWDTSLVFILSRKLDKNTEREWERYRKENELPSLEEFKAFIKSKGNLLETLEFNHRELKQNTKFKGSVDKSSSFKSFKVSTNTSTHCTFCSESHYIGNCPEFLKLTTNDRLVQVKNRKLCFNCLRNNHFLKNCKSGHCLKCKSKHHTLLHKEIQVKEPNESKVVISNQDSILNANRVVLSNHTSEETHSVLLSTALIQIKDTSGQTHSCRALLDSGSQSNLITYDLCNKLRLKHSEIDVSIIGIGQTVSKLKDRCTVTIQSNHTNFKKTISCLLLPKISDFMPEKPVNLSSITIPSHIKLADPNFNNPGPIDLLIGASLFYNLLSDGQIFLGKNQPVLQNTSLGWVISGPISSFSQASTTRCNLNTNTEIQSQLAKFWELEEPLSASKILSAEERTCEEIFLNTTIRDHNNRFVVKIPLKYSPFLLGNSQHTALQRFCSLENKLTRSPKLQQMYSDFMSEYEQLGHIATLLSIS